MLTIMAFTLHGYSAMAMDTCNCSMTGHHVAAYDTNETAPCHEMVEEKSADSQTAKADDTIKDTPSSSTHCQKCGCGGCKLPTQASLAGHSQSDHKVTKEQRYPLLNGAIPSPVLYGIDYPPKRLS